jgi:hypothetical protein
MSLRTVPLSATDDDIRQLVVEWSETIARGDFGGALAMFLSAGEWTPDSLRKTIEGYGVPDIDAPTLTYMLADWEVDEFRVTSLFNVANAEEFIRKAIHVDRENPYGLDPEHYLGMVHYNDVPLSGYVSDLTARFHLKKAGGDRMTLEFLDIHVM